MFPVFPRAMARPNGRTVDGFAVSYREFVALGRALYGVIPSEAGFQAERGIWRGVSRWCPRDPSPRW
ncbi:hypothetical protein SBA1_550066 [Candidatus Sulfotelmatobacter kueseliae]|uniref:Uncharacterized protein n=1 Tax=Candidatus Sulfotelmatobacter kueseliae TaxID=2042962 RepID=A0A2U3KYG6_9BACT|nr:hypothetical protein SBA1_550066 [Candidatus Sulfotelmatobacter kueseliae]